MMYIFRHHDHYYAVRDLGSVARSGFNTAIRMCRHCSAGLLVPAGCYLITVYGSRNLPVQQKSVLELLVFFQNCRVLRFLTIL
jgi:hypothetical protein